MIEQSSQTSHCKIYYPAPDLTLNSIIVIAFSSADIKSEHFLLVVFSMLFGRQNKFLTFMYFFPLYMFKYFIRLLTTTLKAQHWGGSLAQVFLHHCFFCLPCTECTIFVQRDHYLVMTFFCSYSCSVWWFRE